MTFTASNGIEISTSEDHTLGWRDRRDNAWGDERTWHYVGEPSAPGGVPGFTTKSRVYEALREYFRRGEDERLGRWRSKENPGYVVYPTSREGYFYVVSEEHGQSVILHVDHLKSVGRDWANPLRAYVDAHPVKKPWHDAEEGDIWVLQTEDYEGEFPYTFEESWNNVCYFERNDANSYELTDKRIISGRKIWPES